jgi:hypothetical protein
MAPNGFAIACDFVNDDLSVIPMRRSGNRGLVAGNIARPRGEVGKSLTKASMRCSSALLAQGTKMHVNALFNAPVR